MKGPDWLRETLPNPQDSDELPEGCIDEAQNKQGDTVSMSVITTPSRIIRVENYSMFRKLHRDVGQVFRFVRILWNPLAPRAYKELSVSDLQLAHDFLVHSAQEAQSEDKTRLGQRQFWLFMDQAGILKCRVRLSNADLPADVKFPIFLENQSVIACLLVMDCHLRMGHSGVNDALVELRTKYWVTRAQKLVKQAIYSCVICRRFHGKPYGAPSPPLLPSLRVDEKPPFTYTGVDFAGPVHTCETLSSTTRRTWFCLFTCCVMWVVQLELVMEMDTAAFLRCFKRFTSRRGVPVKILSDNAKTFKSADKWLKDVAEQSGTKDHMLQNGINWQFIVVRAPWWGRVFERMV